MKRFNLLIVVITLILFSCKSSNNETGENKPVKENSQIQENTTPADFREVYTDFFTAIKDINEKRFNQYIHPELGLFIIQQDGAMPVITHISDISKFKRNFDNKYFFAINMDIIGVELIEQTLPKVNCEEFNGYDKQGCFAQEVNNLAATKFWEFTDASADLKSKCEKAANTINWTVINTANYGYYFSQIDGKWYITFIDMRQPCSA